MKKFHQYLAFRESQEQNPNNQGGYDPSINADSDLRQKQRGSVDTSYGIKVGDIINVPHGEYLAVIAWVGKKEINPDRSDKMTVEVGCLTLQHPNFRKLVCLILNGKPTEKIKCNSYPAIDISQGKKEGNLINGTISNGFLNATCGVYRDKNGEYVSEM